MWSIVPDEVVELIHHFMDEPLLLVALTVCSTWRSAAQPLLRFTIVVHNHTRSTDTQLLSVATLAEATHELQAQAQLLSFLGQPVLVCWATACCGDIPVPALAVLEIPYAMSSGVCDTPASPRFLRTFYAIPVIRYAPRPLQPLRGVPVALKRIAENRVLAKRVPRIVSGQLEYVP